MAVIKPTLFHDDSQPLRNRLWIAWLKGAITSAILVGGGAVAAVSRLL